MNLREDLDSVDLGSKVFRGFGAEIRAKAFIVQQAAKFQTWYVYEKSDEGVEVRRDYSVL